MFSRIRRKWSRAKTEPSLPEAEDLDLTRTWTKTLSLTPSDEQIISRLSFAPETQLVERPPRYQSPSLLTRWSERTVFNNVESGFLALPTEILLHLQLFLTPSSEVALRHTCSRFYHLFQTPSFYLSGDEKWNFICYTERDQDPNELDRLVCGRCRELHPKKAFPASEIHQRPGERDCRQVWLCAHRALGYQRTVKFIKAGVEAPFRSENLDPCSRCRECIRHRSIADRPDKGTSESAIEDPNSQALLISKIALLQAPSPAYTTRGQAAGMYVETFQVKDVSAALQSINFRICPHIKLGDPCILSTFCRACISTQRLPPGVKGPPCISETRREFSDLGIPAKCKGSCWYRSCKTKFMFQARESLAPDASGKRQVWLFIVIYRWLGPLLTAKKDAKWLDHTVDHWERGEMREAWDNWDRGQRARHCLPNWNICLLDPEDCNLR